jgi:hypothetical protein
VTICQTYQASCLSIRSERGSGTPLHSCPPSQERLNTTIHTSCLVSGCNGALILIPSLDISFPATTETSASCEGNSARLSSESAFTSPSNLDLGDPQPKDRGFSRVTGETTTPLVQQDPPTRPEAHVSIPCRSVESDEWRSQYCDDGVHPRSKRITRAHKEETE